jgi:hypothetical protein
VIDPASSQPRCQLDHRHNRPARGEAALYRLRIWTEREWSEIPAEAQPHAELMPGLGWVGGDFIEALN